MFFDMAGDGRQHRTSWAGAGDGVLALDLAGTGQITERNQIVFTDWDPTASNDMQALANLFDTNRDGRLDAGDAQFSKFKLLVTNADGTTTLKTLAQAGVTSNDRTEQTRGTKRNEPGQASRARPNTRARPHAIRKSFDQQRLSHGRRRLLASLNLWMFGQQITPGLICPNRRITYSTASDCASDLS
jgi:hypothetical protein